MRSLWMLPLLVTVVSPLDKKYAGSGVNLVLPYSWHTDSVYTYDFTVDWYRSARYDFGFHVAPSLQLGFDEQITVNWRFGLEVGYTYAPPATATIATYQQVGATLVSISEKATLSHHAPRLSARFSYALAGSWSFLCRLGIEDHIVERRIEPQPQNLPAGVNLRPANYPSRRDTYAVLTADIAAGLEYVADGRHGIAFIISVNPPIVYPETIRNHIVMPYFAMAGIAYRYIW